MTYIRSSKQLARLGDRNMLSELCNLGSEHSSNLCSFLLAQICTCYRRRSLPRNPHRLHRQTAIHEYGNTYIQTYRHSIKQLGRGKQQNTSYISSYDAVLQSERASVHRTCATESRGRFASASIAGGPCRAMRIVCTDRQTDRQHKSSTDMKQRTHSHTTSNKTLVSAFIEP